MPDAAVVAGVVAAVAAVAVVELLALARPPAAGSAPSASPAAARTRCGNPRRSCAPAAGPGSPSTRGRDQERLQAHVAQTGDRARRVVGVQRAEHHVAGQRRLHGDLGRFQVADLADQDLVRVLPQDGTQGRGERQADLVIDRALDDAVDVVLDRVFGGDDLVGDLVQLVESRVERGGLAGAGRAGDQDDAVGLVDQLAELRPASPAAMPTLFEVERHDGAVEHADDDAFAEHGRQDADAHVDRVAADVQLDAAVLRQAALGDVEVGHDLDAAGDGHGQVARRRHHLVEHAVAAVAHLVFVFERLEVDVAGLVLDGQQEHHVDELADRGGVLDFHAGFPGRCSISRRQPAQFGVGSRARLMMSMMLSSLPA